MDRVLAEINEMSLRNKFIIMGDIHIDARVVVASRTGKEGSAAKHFLCNDNDAQARYRPTISCIT